MSLPAFLGRVHNAAGPLLGGIAESEFGDRLSGTTLLLEIGAEEAADPAQHAAYLLAANLGARLYPRLALDAPKDLQEKAADLTRGINPLVEFGTPKGRTLTLSWCGGEPSVDRITVAAQGWTLELDGESPAGAAEAPAAMAAASLAIGEAFRSLFADLLDHGRNDATPFAVNLVTLGDPAEIPPLPNQVELGDIHLAGCGAIGQAAAATFAELPVAGTLFACDHETLDEGNLQRYLLSGATDVGSPKPALIQRALAAGELKVEQVPSRWGEEVRTHPGRQTVLAALDTKQGRIELQANLPREIFNAWTQQRDLGVSRHQSFGTEEPCLACLYWPSRPRPSESEQIADALGEHELRVIQYLLSRIPVGQPLGPDQLQGTVRLPIPEQAGDWLIRSLLDDLIDRYQLSRQSFQALAGLGIRGLYRDAICAGMLIEHGASRGDDVSVPLAHQSALAGILLATALVVDRVPELREIRPAGTVAKYDVLRGGAQIWTRASGRNERCICFDGDYLKAYSQRWA